MCSSVRSKLNRQRTNSASSRKTLRKVFFEGNSKYILKLKQSGALKIYFRLKNLKYYQIDQGKKSDGRQLCTVFNTCESLGASPRKVYICY